MKILHIINSLGTGGAEKLLLDTLPLYNAAGLQADILLLWDNNFPFSHMLKKENCCRMYILKKSTDYKDVYLLSHILKIRKIIKDYDIVHVHLFPAQYFTALANMGVNKKLIFTEHNTSNRRINNPKYKLLEKWCYAQYSKVICISEGIYNAFDRYLHLSQKSAIIQNGVNLQTIQQAQPVDRRKIHPSIQPKDVLLLQVAGFRKQKDQDTVIKSLPLLPQNYKLLLVGDGERRPTLERLTQSLNLSERVFFLGQRMDVASLMKTADILILSSHYEGLSLASVEGLASGKPFIASNVPGLREVVNGAGLLFEEGNEQELSALILKLTKSPEYAREIAERGAERAKEFDISKMVSQHIQLYQEVLSH